MSKQNYLILLNLLVIGCTTINTNDVKPGNNQGLSTPTPFKTIIPTASPTPTVIPTPAKTVGPVITATPSPSPSSFNNTEELSQLNFISGFIQTPDNAFLVVKPFELKIKLAIDKFPGEKKIITLFDVYDAGSSPKNTHYSLSLDDKNHFLLKAKNSKEEVNLNIPFEDIVIGRFYEITFKRDNEKIEFFVNNNSLFSREFKDDDFIDKEGRRTLNIGADLNGENRFSGKLDYVEVKDILYYDFKNNLDDSGKFLLDAIGSGQIKFITSTSPVPTATPSVISSETPLPTPVPSAINRNVKDTSNNKLTMGLNVYEPKDKEQYDACVKRKKIENNSIPSSAIQIECLNGYGQFTSEGYDFGASKTLTNEPGDMRFLTYIDQVGSQLIITGNSSQPNQVLILDIGQKNFDGIDAKYLAEKVDYTNENKIFSSSNASSNVIEDHVYAIKSYRYGENPRYAKVVINNIITDDYKDLDFNPPRIISQPAFVPADGGSTFLTTSSYTYYISIFDGTGETIPLKLDTIAPDAGASTSNVEISFELPYNSRGFTIYKKDDTKIVQIGPFLAKAETDITFVDKGNKGVDVTKIPNQDTTVKSAFKPTATSRPIEIKFSYYFDGDGDLLFN